MPEPAVRVAVIYLGRRSPGSSISLELATHLARKTELFAAVCSHAENFTQWQKSGIDLIPVETFSSDTAAALSLLSQGKLKSLAAEIAERKPDVIVYPMIHPWTPWLQRYLRKIPHVITVHDATPHPGLKHFASSLWERMSARRAARCVVMSQRFVGSMAERGVSPERIDVIPLGIFSFHGTQGTQRVPTGNGTRSILFFGRITAYKGLDVLLRAFEILERRRQDIRLDIVGSGEMKPYASLLKKLRSVNLVNRWIGDNEVAPFFENATIAVLPYTTASQSGVVPLAAAFRVPVVATTVGALPDQVRTGETGLLVSPNSVDELVEAMETLLDRPDLAARMGDSLSRTFTEMGDWDHIADAYLESCGKALRA